jgi:ABC-2 type transport system ATP-binding protein
VLDITVQSSDLDRVAAVLAGIGTAAPQVEAGARKVSVPVGGGANDLVEAVRRLDDEGISVLDITLRRPSLDDVFLALTGHTTREETETVEEAS